MSRAQTPKRESPAISDRVLRARTPVRESPVRPSETIRRCTPVRKSPARPFKTIIERTPRVSPAYDDDSDTSITQDGRRPKYPYHFAVTMALLNLKKPYVDRPEVYRFIEEYIPGWEKRTAYYTPGPSHYNKLIQIEGRNRLILKPNKKDKFESRIRKWMERYPDRSSWEYGLADPDDWEPLIRGELLFSKSRLTPPPFWLPHNNNESELNQEPANKKRKIDGKMKVGNAQKLDLRWILDLAVLYNGNRLPSFSIFEFVTKNFPQYKTYHNWRHELMRMVALKRMNEVKGILEWRKHYVVADNEIREFQKAIDEFMDANPDTQGDAYGLASDVKWEDVLPYELITCITTYLDEKPNNKKRRSESTSDDEATNIIPTGVKTSKPRRAVSMKTPKKIKNEYQSSAVRQFPNAARTATERAARVVRRNIRQEEDSGRPIYRVPNPNLPRPSRIVEVDADALVPVHNGEFEDVEEREISSPFDGLFLPQEFLKMSSDIMKTLPQVSQDEDNDGQDFPSDLQGIEPASWLDEISADENTEENVQITGNEQNQCSFKQQPSLPLDEQPNEVPVPGSEKDNSTLCSPPSDETSVLADVKIEYEDNSNNEEADYRESSVEFLGSVKDKNYDNDITIIEEKNSDYDTDITIIEETNSMLSPFSHRYSLMALRRCVKQDEDPSNN